MEEPETCRASQLVARLQTMIAEHGDLPVYVDDAEMQSPYPLGLVHRHADGDGPSRFEVTTTWLQEMIAEHGDLPVYVDDLEMGEPRDLGLIHEPENKEYPSRFEITTGFDDDPRGYIEPLSP